MLAALLAAAFIAAHPVGIKCDADTNNPFPFPVDGWAEVGGTEFHLTQRMCDGLSAPMTSDAFADSLGVLIHEAAHSRGVESEACAELYARVAIYEVLHRFWSMDYFSRKARRIADRILWRASFLPPEYQPVPTSCDDQP